MPPCAACSPGFEDGDSDDPETHFSPFPGNVNNLLVYLPTYAKAVSGEDAGVVEEFVNPKYVDSSRTTFKKPTRLECMMQDLPKLLAKEVGAAAKVGFTTMERWLTFSPAKNAPGAGAALAAAGSPPGSPGSSEADVYAAWRRILAQACGAAIGAGPEQAFAGLKLRLLPAVSLAPSFAATSSELARRFGPGARISGTSCLVVRGDVTVGGGLDLDGALVLAAAPGTSLTVAPGLRVRNKGWEFAPVDVDDGGAPEHERIRGFALLKHEALIVEVSEPGDWLLDADFTVSKA